MILELFGIIAPVFVCALVGFLWRRAGRAYSVDLVTDLVTNIGAPALVFSSLVSLRLETDLMWQLFGATAVAIGLFAVVGAIVLRIVGLPQTSFLAPLMFPNSGNLSMPLSFFAFGPEGLALATCFFAVTAILHFTLGLWVWTGTTSLRVLISTPVAWASVLAVGVVVTDLSLPLWLLRSVELVADFTIPLMLLTLGVSIAELRAERLPQSVVLGLVRIGMGIAVGFGLSELFGFEGAARGVFVLACSAPPAVFNYLFAARYERDASEVASLVLVGTLLSLVSFPLVLGVLLR